MLKNYSTILPIVSVSFILCLINIQSGHSWGGDFSLYLAQAKALLTGNTHELYWLNKFSMDHSELPLGPYLYPMGYPAILAPAYHFFGLNFIALKIYNLLFFIGSIPLVFSLLKSVGASRRLAFYSTFLFAINYQLVYFSDRLGSEFAFMFFSFLSLHLMLRARKRISLFNAVCIGLAIFAAFSTRVSAMVLFPTLLAFQIFEFLKTKEFSWKLNLVPYASFGIAWLFYSQAFDSMDDRYLEVFEVSASSLWFTFIGFGERMMEFVLCLKYFPDALKVGVAALFYPILVMGIRNVIKHENIFLLTFCASVIGMHLIVPFVDIRFLFPVAPFVIYAFLSGFTKARTKLIPIEKYDIVKGLSYAVLFVGFAQSFMTISAQAISGSNRAIDSEIKEIYAFINEYIPDEELIIFHKPRVLRLFTKNNGILVNDYQSKNAQMADLLLIKKDEFSGTGFTVTKEWKSFQLMERKD